ncbi:hypothetical protein [Streptococcus sp. S784/96/1]|uniref:hypothetical protein n=1 Tax=Streptococcus sp. S784/96/1 TaxID=2653499 RepID=UPI0013876365|nr:hypothetical protein [Streptococcus sp. S784/96/1]
MKYIVYGISILLGGIGLYLLLVTVLSDVGNSKDSMRLWGMLSILLSAAVRSIYSRYKHRR